jgi:signal transduction histidine kinase
VLILMLGAAALRAGPPWKMVYLHLLGASFLYALSSTLANIATDAGGYANGKLYGLGLTASVCWFVWIPLSARLVPAAESTPTRFLDKQDSQVSAWAMLSVVMISIPMAGELLQRDENPNVRTLRLIVATAAIVLLAGCAYLREHLDKRELAWSFNRKLIQAQEAERIRIARELHDDISQRVAVLGFRLEQLKATPDGLSDDTLKKVSRIQKEATEISTSVVHLSHELHSPTLELLGLSAAIRSWCSEFSENRKVEISFDSRDVPAGLSSEISLNLYRVLQEALNNAAKYSGARRFDVRLWGTPAETYLSVSDHGKGFDISAAMKGRGLGLKSMRERVKLMNGLLTIESEPNCGTTILARVPVHSGSQASQGTRPD